MKAVFSAFFQWMGSLDCLGFAEMPLFHGNPSAPGAYVLHGRKLFFTYVGGIHMGCAAEAALGPVATGIAQMSGLFCYRTTIFARIGHVNLLNAVHKFFSYRLLNLKSKCTKSRCRNVWSIFPMLDENKEFY
jgi:hypothetical protein